MGTGAQAESPSFVWAPYVPVHLPAFHTTEAENELIEYMGSAQEKLNSY